LIIIIAAEVNFVSHRLLLIVLKSYSSILARFGD
jgi:hypothetical protein